jgi:hypothetical protein
MNGTAMKKENKMKNRLPQGAMMRVALGLLVLLTPLAVLRAQNTLTAGTWYNIVNQNSGSCVDDTGSGTANGTHVQQWACANGTSSTQNQQQWEFLAAGNGSYYVANHNAPTETWNVTGNATANGGLIQTWTYGGASNEQWNAVSMGSGYYKFVGVGSGRCLDTPGASTANGVQLQIYDCNGTAAQSFKLVTPGGSGGGGGGGGGGGAPSKLFAPYLYLGDYGNANVVSGIQSSSGVKGVTLAFLTPSGNGCNLIWPGANGVLPNNDSIGGTTVASQISTLQSRGVTVIISTGGAGATDPSAYCSSASAFQAVYQSLINKYNVKWLDFDIEIGQASGQITRRSQGLAALQAANSGLIISYTLPAGPGGLDSGDNGTNLLSSAKSYGLNLNVVNIMAMDYGGSGINMASYATQGAAAAHSQIQSAGLSSTVGITPMIGQNDSGGEVFSLANASTVVSFANSNSYVSLLGFWSMARDNGGCAGNTTASGSCSGVSQSNYQFSSIFNAF